MMQISITGFCSAGYEGQPTHSFLFMLKSA